MKSSKLWISVLIFLGVYLTGCGNESEPKSPNLIFIFSDEHVYHAAPGGIDVVETPNLERLAREGMTFTNCISNNPVCVPYRATLLTGLHGHQNGFINNHARYPLDPALPSWSRILKDNGYSMGYVGKWHLYPGCEAPRFAGDGDGTGIDRPAAQTPPEFRMGFDDLWIQSSNHNKPRDTYIWDVDGQYKKIEGYAPSTLMSRFIGYIENHKDDQAPFCGVLSLLPPHPSYSGALPEWVDYYHSLETPFWGNVPEEHRTENNMKNLKDYYAQVSSIDQEVGRLLKQLDEWGIADNTILIFTADHGDLHFAHGEKWKRWPWDESIKVPFIIRYPGKIEAGVKSDVLLGSIDLAPTLLGLSGFHDKIPVSWQGMDLSGLFFGETIEEPASQLILFNLPAPDHYILAKQPNLVDYRGVRTKKYTYTLKKDAITGKVTPWQLYDNENDPLQLINLTNQAGMESVQAELYNQILWQLNKVQEETWLKNTPKDFPGQ